MMGFKKFVLEQSSDTLAKRELSELKAELSAVEGELGKVEEGPKKARLNKSRLQLLEALKRKQPTASPKARKPSL